MPSKTTPVLRKNKSKMLIEKEPQEILNAFFEAEHTLISQKGSPNSWESESGVDMFFSGKTSRGASVPLHGCPL